MKLVLDTCALLYWTLEPARLSDAASAALLRMGDGATGLICSASIWEIALKHGAGRLDLGMDPAHFLERLRELPVEILPVDAELWLESVTLDWAHRDPVDRLIVALARREGAPVITSDRVILGFHPRTIW